MTHPPFAKIALAVVSLFLCTCSSDETGKLQPGTPEWYWVAAHEASDAANYTKTREHLEHVVTSELDVKRQAVVWQTLILAGLSRGYMELGDAYSDTAEQNPRLVREVQNSIQQYRRTARRYAIALTESMKTFRTLIEASEQVSFDFSFPTGSPAISLALTQLKTGQMLPPNQLRVAEKETIERGIVLQATAMVGTGADVNRARVLFDNRPVMASSVDFLWHVGDAIYYLSGLFNSARLNEPMIQKIMLETSLDCIGPILEIQGTELNEHAKKLKKKITEQQSKLKI